MKEVLFAVLILTVLGILLGFGLAIASKIFHVEADTRIDDIEKILPGLTDATEIVVVPCDIVRIGIYNGTKLSVTSTTTEALLVCSPVLPDATNY